MGEKTAARWKTIKKMTLIIKPVTNTPLFAGSGEFIPINTLALDGQSKAPEPSNSHNMQFFPDILRNVVTRWGNFLTNTAKFSVWNNPERSRGDECSAVFTSLSSEPYCQSVSVWWRTNPEPHAGESITSHSSLRTAAKRNHESALLIRRQDFKYYLNY